MARLTAVEVRTATTTKKVRKLYDERGLFLRVQPNGSKLWRFKYRFEGKEKLLSLGAFPEVSLKEARATRDEYRAMVRRGVNPSDVRKDNRRDERGTFGAVAAEWWAKHQGQWAPVTRKKWRRLLERDLLPWLAEKPIDSISAPDLLKVVRRVEQRGHAATAARVVGMFGRIARYAVVSGLASKDISTALRGAVVVPSSTPRAAITEPKKLGEFLRALDSYSGLYETKTALQLLVQTFVRVSELLGARWREVDFEKRLWSIPADRMKQGKPHLVPLSKQSLELFRELHRVTGSREFVFASPWNRGKPIAHTTMLQALRRMDFSPKDVTLHGFRTTASTLLHERGWWPDVIERQLAHVERSSVRAVYNRSEYLDKRKDMMQDWSDYLDELKR